MVKEVAISDHHVALVLLTKFVIENMEINVICIFSSTLLDKLVPLIHLVFTFYI